MFTPTKIPDVERPFHVSFTHDELIKGFMTMEAAEADAKERNLRALDLGLHACYLAAPKP